MKNPINFFNEMISTNTDKQENDNTEKMDFLMRVIKAARSNQMNRINLSSEEIEKQRNDSERLSKLVTPTSLVEVQDFDVAHIKCECVYPKFVHRNDKAILYCHGGGYTNGGIYYARILAVKLAQVTGLKVYSFEYRLAPEHPYPAGIDDGEKVWNYLMHKGYGAKDVIIAGDSAGGNMALEIMLRLKEEKRILPKAAILMSPWTDMRLNSSSYENYKDKDPMLSYDYVEAVRNAYAGPDADYEDYHFSPILADLSAMPPTLIQVGSNEILRDDSENLRKKYTKYGSYAKLEVYQGCWHVFQQMPILKAQQAMNSIKAFVDEYI